MPENIEPGERAIELLNDLVEDGSYETVLRPRNDAVEVEVQVSRYPMVGVRLFPRNLFIDGDYVVGKGKYQHEDRVIFGVEKQILELDKFELKPVGMNDDGPMSVDLHFSEGEDGE